MVVKLTKEVHAKVKKISGELNMPMTQVINMLCSQWIKENS